jgi:hypothetical protein
MPGATKRVLGFNPRLRYGWLIGPSRKLDSDLAGINFKEALPCNWVKF